MVALIYHPLTPTISVLIVVSICGGRPALRELFARFRPWQNDVAPLRALAWWAVAIGTGVAISLGIAVIQYSTAAPGTFKWTPGQFGLLPPLMWFLAAMFTDGGGCGEELGWRGFALPYLQARYSPLKASMILGVMWSAWHWSTVVLNYMDNLQALIPYLMTFTMFCIALTIVMTFFSNKLGGSALIAVMLHGLANDSMQLKGVVTGQGGIVEGSLLISMPCIVVAAIIVVATKGRLGFNSEEPGRRIWIWPTSHEIK
jgi:membrane protease YdiL (CAAX protease family)